MIIRLWNYTYIMLPRNIFSVVMHIGIIVVHKHQSKCNYSLQLVSHPFFLHRNKRTYILHLPIQDMCPLFWCFIFSNASFYLWSEIFLFIEDTIKQYGCPRGLLVKEKMNETVLYPFFLYSNAIFLSSIRCFLAVSSTRHFIWC